MQCPMDGAQLVMSDRNGVEIDYCPTCRGVWLDRGELDKIIERSGASTAPQAHPSRSTDPQDYRSSHDRKLKKKNKMGCFLEDIFDF